MWQLVQQRLFGRSQITQNSDQLNQTPPEHLNLKDEPNPLHSTHPFSLEELIQAAVDYFFGMRSEQTEVSGHQSRIKLPSVQKEDITALWGVAKTRLQKIKQGIPALTDQRPLYLNASEPVEPPAESSVPPLSTEANPFTIRALLWAAIDYFFGTKFTHQALAGVSEDRSQNPGQPGKFSAIGNDQTHSKALGGDNSAIADPWLSWEDVFPTSSSTARVITHPSHQPLTDDSALPSSHKTPSHRSLSAWESLRNRLQRLKAVRFLRTRNKSSDQITNPQQTDHSDLESNNQAISPRWDLRDPLDTAFDWVEADVTASGYIKHPLEKILEWLDSFILWLEQLWEKLWARLA